MRGCFARQETALSLDAAPATTATIATNHRHTLPRTTVGVKVLPRCIICMTTLLPASKLFALVEHPTDCLSALADVV